jgi:hypothetical protein
VRCAFDFGWGLILDGAALQRYENWLSLTAALPAAEVLQGLTLRIRVCLQAYRESLKMLPALAAAVTVVARKRTFSAASSAAEVKMIGFCSHL